MTGTRSALRRRARDTIELVTCERIMKKIRESAESEEPIGIVISRGDRTEQRPVFSAYIWGPAPDQVAEPATKVA